MLPEKQKALDELGITVEMYDELLQLFIGQTEEALVSLQALIPAGPFEDIAKQAHFIKGSAGNLRLEQMHVLARQIEFGAKEKQERTTLADIARQLQTAFDDVRKNSTS